MRRSATCLRMRSTAAPASSRPATSDCDVWTLINFDSRDFSAGRFIPAFFICSSNSFSASWASFSLARLSLSASEYSARPSPVTMGRAPSAAFCAAASSSVSLTRRSMRELTASSLPLVSASDRLPPSASLTFWMSSASAPRRFPDSLANARASFLASWKCSTRSFTPSTARPNRLPAMKPPSMPPSILPTSLPLPSRLFNSSVKNRAPRAACMCSTRCSRSFSEASPRNRSCNWLQLHPTPD